MSIRRDGLAPRYGKWVFAEVRDVTGRLSNAWQQLMLPRGQPAEIAPSPMPQNRRKIASAHCTLTLVVAPPCDSIFLLQLARPPFVAFVAVAPPAIGHAMRCDASPENKSPYDLRVGVFSIIFSPCFYRETHEGQDGIQIAAAAAAPLRPHPQRLHIIPALSALPRLAGRGSVPRPAPIRTDTLQRGERRPMLIYFCVLGSVSRPHSRMPPTTAHRFPCSAINSFTFSNSQPRPSRHPALARFASSPPPATCSSADLDPAVATRQLPTPDTGHNSSLRPNLIQSDPARSALSQGHNELP